MIREGQSRDAKRCPECQGPMDKESRLCWDCRQRTNPTPAERFWAKVDKRGEDECWPWKASLGTWGYGSFWLAGKNINSSQAAYILTHGSTDGLSVLHVCDNPRCCNPAHLFLGTQGDNVRDCVAKGRAKGHFVEGFDPRRIR